MKLLLLNAKRTVLLLWVSGLSRIHLGPHVLSSEIFVCFLRIAILYIYPYTHVCINHAQLMFRQDITLGHDMEGVQEQYKLAHVASTIYTGLFISPSGISELDCATTKTDTAERSISIGRESLQVFFLY